MSIGKVIKSERKKRNIPLRRLAELSGVSFSQIGKIERGEHRPSIHTIKALAAVLKLDRKELIILNDLNENDKMPEDYIKRYSILIRDKFTCQLCGASAPETKVDIERIIPDINGKLELKESEFTTLCNKCSIARKNQLRLVGIEKDILYNRFHKQ
jgi:transcriptional regulator with XRE-family HTH domain